MFNNSDLSPRELQIAESYAAGCSYQEIAADLHIAPSTVRTHLATIYRKLEVSSKVELASRLSGASAVTRSQEDHAAVISELALSLEEALNREKALSEVLRIIGASQGDLNLVMPAILRYALDLCDAEFGILFECRDSKRFRASFTLGIPSAFQNWLDGSGTFSVSDQSGLGRMTIQGSVMNFVYLTWPMRFQILKRRSARRTLWRTGCGLQTIPGHFCHPSRICGWRDRSAWLRHHRSGTSRVS